MKALIYLTIAFFAAGCGNSALEKQKVEDIKQSAADSVHAIYQAKDLEKQKTAKKVKTENEKLLEKLRLDEYKFNLISMISVLELEVESSTEIYKKRSRFIAGRTAEERQNELFNIQVSIEEAKIKILEYEQELENPTFKFEKSF